MARWIGTVGCLLMVNAASAQLAGHPNEVSAPVSPGALPAAVLQADPSYVPADPSGPYSAPVYQPDPYRTAVQAQAIQYPPVPQPGPYTPVAQEVPAVAPYPVYPEPVAPQTVSYQPQPVPPPQPLEIVVYNVADMVVGQNLGSDANRTLLAMLAAQSDEVALTLQAAAAAGDGETPQHAELEELGETIESTFAAEFQDDRSSIMLHRGTLSLIVRQTENVHEQIRDLLDQLRRANDTRISVAIELVALDEERTAFAFAHNGQVLDGAALAEFRGLAQQGEAEQMKFSITARNGESTSMPAYGLPGTLTAVASPDRREVRVLLGMLFGMEMGMSQQHSLRIPTGQTVLTIFPVEDTGYVVLLSAEIEDQEELEDALFGPEDATLLPATHAEPAPPSEFVSQVPRPLIGTQAAFVEVDALPENFLEQLLERFDGEILPGSEPYAAVLQSATGNDVVLAMQEDHADLRIISKPQTSWGSSGGEGSLHIGRDVPVIYGIAFEDDVIVPLARHQDIGIWLNSVFTVTDDGSIESRVQVTRKKVLDEEVVVYSSPDQTITSPVIGSATASTTFTVPQGKTVVWLVPPTGDTQSDDSTLLIFLTSQVRGDADHAE